MKAEQLQAGMRFVRRNAEGFTETLILEAKDKRGFIVRRVKDDHLQETKRRSPTHWNGAMTHQEILTELRAWPEPFEWRLDWWDPVV